MRHRGETSVSDLLLHYGHRLEIALGRGELLQALANSIEGKDPGTARALFAVADDMITEAQATMAEVQVMANAARLGTLTGQVEISLYRCETGAGRCLAEIEA